MKNSRKHKLRIEGEFAGLFRRGHRIQSSEPDSKVDRRGERGIGMVKEEDGCPLCKNMEQRLV